MGTITSSSLILTSDVATMVAWSLKKKEAEKKPDPKAAALPFYKRFTYPFTRKQTLLGLLIFSLILSVLAVVTWYVVYQLELLPAGVHASFHTLATTFLISQGMGTGGQSNTSEALHRPKLGQSQIMEDSKHEPRKSQLSESSADQAAIHARSS